MSAPSSDPPQDPPANNNEQPQDTQNNGTTNAEVEATENQPLLAQESSTGETGGDVQMEDTAPPTKEDDFEDIPEHILNVSG